MPLQRLCFGPIILVLALLGLVTHLYCFQIRGWQFGDPARAIELALAGGGVDIPMAAFAFEINGTFRYQYNLLVP